MVYNHYLLILAVSILLIWTTKQNIHSVSNNRAILTLQLEYFNEHHLSENGKCDFLNNNVCDVFMIICISSSLNKCDIYFYQTEVYHETKFLQFMDSNALQTFLKYPIPVTANLKITVLDYDKYSKNDVIGTFFSQNMSLKSKELFQDVKMASTNVLPPSIKLRIWSQVTCLKNFFGELCNVYCESDFVSFECSENGTRICLDGYSGKYCNVTDACVKEPCAKNAVCIPNEYGRHCVCNNTNNNECYLLDDPCIPSPCLHKGICLRDSSTSNKFVCKCSILWKGSTCNERISPCEIMLTEESILWKYSRKRDRVSKPLSICLNDGVCVDHPKLPKYICACKTGWSGIHCETKITSYRMLVISFISCAAIIVAVIIICSLIYVAKRRTWKKRIFNLVNRDRFVYHHPEPNGKENNNMGIENKTSNTTSEYADLLSLCSQNEYKIIKCNSDDNINAPPLPDRPDYLNKQ